MVANCVADILADVERDAVEAYGRHLRDPSTFSAADRERERDVFASDLLVEASWVYEHARIILQQRHDEVFGQFTSRASPRDAKGWVKELAKNQMRSSGSVVRNGRVVLRSDFCMLLTEGQRQQAMRLSIAVGGKLKALSRYSVGDGCRSYKERAAAMILGYREGPDIAAEYYKEVHGLVARFEQANSYPQVWRVIFDLGEVDQVAHEARVEKGRKRKVLEALLDGPLRKVAVAERRVVCAHLARLLGQASPALKGAEHVASMIGAFVGVQSFHRCLAIRQSGACMRRLR